MIQISISPNLQKDDIRRAVSLLFSPINWFNIGYTLELEKKLEKFFGKKYHALVFNSGRSAFYVILKALDIGSGDEVIVQSFTCAAAVNPIIWSGAVPVYADVDNSFNINPLKIQKLITPLTKAIVIQHTFGIPAQIEEIIKICKKNNIFLIEDCALSFSGKYKNKNLGTFGDVSFLSFGRDKVISSVYGGAIITNDQNIIKKSEEVRNTLQFPSFLWLMKQLIHPIITFLSLKLYKIGYKKITVGKILLFLSVKLKFIDKPIYPEEYYARKPNVFPLKLPGALSYLALNQLNKIDKLNNHRKIISDIYIKYLEKSKYDLPLKFKDSTFLRFPILIENSSDILKKALDENIILGNWYKSQIYPISRLSDFFYQKGSCPIAESLSSKIINLPTNINISVKEATLLTKKLKSWIK